MHKTICCIFVLHGLPADDHLFPLRAVFADLRVDVDGEEGAGRVEDGVQVGHQRRNHHRHHETAQTYIRHADIHTYIHCIPKQKV